MKRLGIALIVGLIALLTLGSVASAAGPSTQKHEDYPSSSEKQGGEVGPIRFAREQIRIVSEVLDMEPRMVLRALRDGQTILDLAVERDVSLDALKAELAASRQERLAARVEDGTLTQAQADYLNGEADERLNDFLTMSPRQAAHAEALRNLASVLEVSPDEIVTQVQAGSTLAEIVAAAGADVGEVVAGMVALRDARLQEKVALDLLTDTQRRVILERYEAHLTARLSGEGAEPQS